jgi:hypothetical protein
MILIFNKTIPVEGFDAMCVWPFIFIRAESLKEHQYRHEEINGRQQVEMLLLAIAIAGVLLWAGCGWWSLLILPLYFYFYALLWLWRVICHAEGSPYYDNPMEREAYANEYVKGYLKTRMPFAWVKYF